MNTAEAKAIVAQVIERAAKVQQAASVRWCPHEPTPKQAEFLALDNLEAMFGGAAGGGKSDGILMGALDYVHVPGYAALILRRTYKDLAKPGAIMDRAEAWLANTPARLNRVDKAFTFPSGAKLAFGYLEAEQDKYQYQSAEFQYIGIDELTQFTETQYTYMMSRVRRTQEIKARGVPLRMRVATNPGGRGHRWAKRRFVDVATRGKRAFIPAWLDDNPHLDAEEYEKSLAELDKTTHDQLRKGLWVSDDQGLVYKYDGDRNNVAELPDRSDWRFILGVDLGSSEDKPTTAFSVVAFSDYVKTVYTVTSYARADMIPATIAEEINKLRERFDGFERMVVDEGALGKGYGNEFRRRYALPVQAAEKANKLGYRKLYNGDLERGDHLIVEQQCADLVGEYNELTWNEHGDDNEKGQPNHCSDADLYAWRAARHWMAKDENKLPAAGTTARVDELAARRKSAVAARIKNRKDQPWWVRR